MLVAMSWSDRLRSLAGGIAIPLALAACDEIHSPAEPDRAASVDRVVYRAALEEDGPQVVAVAGEIRNASPEPRTVVFANTCLAFLRASFPGGRVVWDSREGRKDCRDRPFAIHLAAGETRPVSLWSTTINILGFELPGGRYRITAYFVPAERGPVEIDVGEVVLEPPPLEGDL